MYGFSEKQLKEIIQIFSSYKEIDEAILFGSRAKGTHKEASDVDIAIKGKNITYSFAAKLKSHLEDDTNLPYFFDIIAYKTITSKELKEHIRIYGKTIISGSKNIPEGWVETTLGEVAVIKGGKRLPKGKSLVINKTKHPYIRITDFNGNAINKNNLQFIPDETFNKIAMYIVNEKDVIISIVGTIGLVAIIDNDLNNASLTENCVKLINLKNVDNYYIYYYLTSGIGQDEINKNTVGAVQKKLPIYGVQNIKVSLPQLTEQKQIAKILTSFDDKIDLLQAQNKTLEDIGQTVFKEWFGKYQVGDELPEGWHVGKLRDVVKKSNTGADAIKKAPIVEYDTGIRCLRIGDLSKNKAFEQWGFSKVTDKNFKQFQLLKYDILITRTSILGLNILIMEDLNSVYNNGLIKISLISSVNPFFIYGFFKNKYYKDYINMINNDTSTRPNMKIDYLLNLPILFPEKKIEIRFSNFMENILNKIKINQSQIQTLTKTRDTLLPKLMSGKIRITNF